MASTDEHIKIIPNTTQGGWVIDGFRIKEKRAHSVYMLTHFHSDHYCGLTKTFDYGKIYCTEATANLAHYKLGVNKNVFEVREIEKPFYIDDIRVIFLDANHCPGAAIVLLEYPNGESLLHTGDFRFDENMLEYTYLKPYSLKHGKAEKQLTHVYLDTTYGHPENIFPHQKLAREFIANVVEMRMKLDKQNMTKTLFVVGSYTIGKERILRDIARQCNCKVFVKKKKFDILKQLKLPYESIFTQMQGEADVYLVDMSDLHWKNVYSMTQALKNTYNHFYIFKPSAMAGRHSKKKIPPGKISVGRSKSIYTITVPYSEHSSFHELRSFCKHVNYNELIPTVYSSPGQLDEINHYMSPTFSFDKKEPTKISIPYERLGLDVFKKSQKKKKKKGTLLQFFKDTPPTKQRVKKESLEAKDELKMEDIPFSCEQKEEVIVLSDSDDDEPLKNGTIKKETLSSIPIKKEVQTIIKKEASSIIKKESSPSIKKESLFGKVRKSYASRPPLKHSPSKKKRTSLMTWLHSSSSTT